MVQGMVVEYAQHARWGIHMTQQVLLDVRDLSISFGGLTAVASVTLQVQQGEIVGIMGPNGSGKTTLFNLISGIYRPSRGSVRFGGTELVGRRPNEIARLGLVRTFQNLRLFNQMTVLENVLVGGHLHVGLGVVDVLLGTGRLRRRESQVRTHVLECLELVGVRQRANDLVGNLSYGDQRRVEIARALAASPRLLLLDEPSAGMNPQETMELGRLIQRLNRSGLSIILIEHNVGMVMRVCHRIVAMESGRVIAAGTPDEIRRHPEVIRAYLGKQGGEVGASAALNR